MITPVFELSQTDAFLIIQIKAPYCKVCEAEMFIDETDFKFYAKPYFLRLNLSGPVVEDGRESAKFDYDTGYFTVKLPKVTTGMVFEGLDMLTKLLAPSKSSGLPTSIEVIDQGTEIDTDCEDIEFDWQIEQVPYTEAELTADGPRYGFANQKTGVFSRIQSEIHDLIDLKDADQTPWDKRKELRQEDETNHFNEDHYMADFVDEDGTIKEMLNFIPAWKECCTSEVDVTITDEEKEKMLKLPRKEYILDKHEQQIALLSLVDLMFAYTYNHVVTEGENNVESGWNICKLSSTLSWLDIPSNMEDVILGCYRRSLCYPLFRNWKLSEKVFHDMCSLFSIGKKQILKSLLEIHSIFNESDPRYVLNDVYITDYCVWIQSIKQKQLDSLANHLNKIQIKRKTVGFHLNTIDQACLLVNEEQLSVSDSLTNQIHSLEITESEHNSKEIYSGSETVQQSQSAKAETHCESSTDDTGSETSSCESESDTSDSASDEIESMSILKPKGETIKVEIESLQQSESVEKKNPIDKKSLNF